MHPFLMACELHAWRSTTMHIAAFHAIVEDLLCLCDPWITGGQVKATDFAVIVCVSDGSRSA